MAHILIYTKIGCPYCERAKELLKSKGVDFEEVLVTGDPKKLTEMIERSGRKTAPEIFIDGTLIGGFAELKALEQEAKLDAILGITKEKQEVREDEKVIIIGTGSAGLTAALYAARGSLAPLVITGIDAGGQLTTTSAVENYPGFPEGILGSDLIDKMWQQAERFGTRFLRGEVKHCDLGERPYPIEMIDGTSLRCHALILASGASARLLELDSERELLGYGVATCATCDAPFFQDKEVIVVGGGDSAVEEAVQLTKYASRVHIVHRREQLRASKIMQERAFENEAIEFIWNTGVQEIYGTKEEGVTGVKLNNTQSGETMDFPCQGVFVAIGHVPNTKFVSGELELDTDGYILTKNGSAETNIAGVFAAGDVQDRRYKQAVTAAGSGCQAALDAERYLETQGLA